MPTNMELKKEIDAVLVRCTQLEEAGPYLDGVKLNDAIASVGQLADAAMLRADAAYALANEALTATPVAPLPSAPAPSPGSSLPDAEAEGSYGVPAFAGELASDEVSYDDIKVGGELVYAGMLHRLGAHRAMSELNDRFVRGNVTIRDPDLQEAMCTYAESEAMRAEFAPARDEVVLDVAADAQLAERVARLCDALDTWGVANRVTTLSNTAPELRAVTERIEDLQRYGAERGRGRSFIAAQAVAQLDEALQIIDRPALGDVVLGSGVLERIAMLLPSSSRPSLPEIGDLARIATSGRKLMRAIATDAAGLDPATVAGPAYELHAAQRSLVHSDDIVVHVADGDEDDAASERDRVRIFLR
jgi:hypothetical protein